MHAQLQPFWQGGRKLFVAALVVTVLAVVMAIRADAATVWDCESTGANSCPAGDKYARGKLDYTITGGSGSGTDWTINQRIFSGSTGGNTGPNDRWKLNSTTDWKHSGTNWVQVGSTSGGTWRTDPTWSPSFTKGSSRTILNSGAIAMLVNFKHEFCIWTQPDGVNWVCTGTSTLYWNSDSQVQNRCWGMSR